jgi:antitoxin component YwqK of YwqJK toxin-antitoxin module
MKIIIPLLCLISCFGCSQKDNSKKLDKNWLDSIAKASDSSYSKPYYRSDFVTAQYYINKKDSIVCQLMKDSGGNIRQIIIAKKDIRTFFGQYYTNGNLQADLPLDEFGQFHGTGIFYFENGKVQSSGTFTHGLKTGQWKVFDEKGKTIATDEYDKNGQIIPQQHP